MSSFTSNSHPRQFALPGTQEDFSTLYNPESSIFDILNDDEGTPPLGLANSCRITKCICNSSRRASTSSCSNSDTATGITTPTNMDNVDYVLPLLQLIPRCKPERRIWTRHVVHSTHDTTTNQYAHVHGIEVSEYKGHSTGDDTRDMETVLVDLPATAKVSSSGTNINLKLVAAGAKESFRYHCQVKAKTWIRQATFVHDNEHQCYIRRKE